MATPAPFLLSIVFLLAFCFYIVTSTSDPAAGRCAMVCHDEILEAELCEAVHGCDAETQSNEEFANCTDPCWPQASSCQRLCRGFFSRILDRCSRSRRCRNDDEGECVWACFFNRMMRRKARVLQRASSTIKKRAQ